MADDDQHQYDYDVFASPLLDSDYAVDEARPRIPSFELIDTTNTTTVESAALNQQAGEAREKNEKSKKSFAETPNNQDERNPATQEAASQMSMGFMVRDNGGQLSNGATVYSTGEHKKDVSKDDDLTDDEEVPTTDTDQSLLPLNSNIILFDNESVPIHEQFDPETRRFFSKYRISKISIQTSFCTSSYSKNDWRQIYEVIKGIDCTESEIFHCVVCKSTNCTCTIYDLFSYAIDQTQTRNRYYLSSMPETINRGKCWNANAPEKFICKMYRSGLFMSLNKRPQVLWHETNEEYKTEYNECRKGLIEYNFEDDDGCFYQRTIERDNLVKLDVLPKEFVSDQVLAHSEENFRNCPEQMKITNKISRAHAGIFLKISPGKSHKTGEMSFLNGLYLPSTLPPKGFFKVFVRLYAPMLVCTLSTFMEDQQNDLYIDPAFRCLELDEFTIQPNNGLSDNFLWCNNYMRSISNFYTEKGHQTVHMRKNATKRKIATGNFVYDNLGMKGIIGSRNRISVCVSAICSNPEKDEVFDWSRRNWKDDMAPNINMDMFKLKFCSLFSTLRVKTFACDVCNFKEETAAPNNCSGCRCKHCLLRPDCFDIPWNLLTRNDIADAKRWLGQQPLFAHRGGDSHLRHEVLCIDCALMYIFTACTTAPKEYDHPVQRKQKKSSKLKRQKRSAVV
jgi:hypothetical protein